MALPPNSAISTYKKQKELVEKVDSGLLLKQQVVLAASGQTVLTDDKDGEPIRAVNGVARIEIQGLGSIIPDVDYTVSADGVITFTDPLNAGDVVFVETIPKVPVNTAQEILSNYREEVVEDVQAVVQGILQQTDDDVRAAEAAADRAEVFGPSQYNNVSMVVASSYEIPSGSIINERTTSHAYVELPFGTDDYDLARSDGVLLRYLGDGSSFPMSAFGCKFSPSVDDTAAAQRCINAAMRAASTTNGGARSVIIIDGPALYANGLVCNHSNVSWLFYGELTSFSAKSSTSFILTVGGTGPDSRCSWNTFTGMRINGAGHANVHGLRAQYYSHFNFYNPVIRGCVGTAGSNVGAGLDIIQGWDSPTWGGYITLCGRADTTGSNLTEKLQRSTPAMRVAASSTLSSNRLLFSHLTFEANSGIDVFLDQPAGSSETNNRNSFFNCKWEQAASYTTYMGVWAPNSQQSIEFTGETYIAGYCRDGGFCDLNIGGSGQVVFDSAGAYTSKNLNITSAAEAPFIIRGNSALKFAIQLSALFTDQGYPVLSTPNKPNDKVDISSATTFGSSPNTWKWLDGESIERSIINMNGDAYYSITVPPSTVSQFTLPYQNGIVRFMAEGGPRRSCSGWVRSPSDLANVLWEDQFKGSSVDVYQGSVPTIGSGRTRYGLMENRVVHIANGQGFAVPIMISMENTK